MGAGRRRGGDAASGGGGPGVAPAPGVCRVVPDLPAVDRDFDYLVPDDWPAARRAALRVGSVVRVELRGRRVRGWVVETDAVPETPLERLRPLAKLSSDGPPADLVALASWAARRWAGPRVSFLRAASPPNVVGPGPAPAVRAGGPGTGGSAEDAETEAIATRARATDRGVVRWPPGARMAELLRRLVEPTGSTIVAIPDAAKASALAAHFRRAGVDAVSVRGDEPHAARTAFWERAAAGAVVVIGGRAAAWAPVPDLSAVVVVDDADEAFQEERAPSWHARDVLAERARRAGARATVVTPAPTLEALEWTDGAVITPPEPSERRGWGRLTVLDRRDDPPGSGLFSPELVEPLRRAADTGRVVCVLNRKGRARLLVCAACGEVVGCDDCGAAVAEGEDGLDCAVCGATRPALCTACGSTSLKRLRPGISRAGEELSALLPGSGVAEVEADTEGLPAAPVLIGTEAVLHRVEAAQAVVFLDFDQELAAPRYRAPEQALWLLVRAARLTARTRTPGTVIVQTRIPDHEVLAAARAGRPHQLAATEAGRRARLGFPPFAALAVADGAPGAIGRLAAGLAGVPGVSVAGPVAASATTERLLVRAPDHATLGDALAAAAPAAREAGRLRVEVDPLRI